MHRVVITGLGAITPLGLNVGETWDGILQGKSGIDRITLFDPIENTTKIAGEVKGFDPNSIKEIQSKYVPHMDRISHLTIAAGIEAMKDARIEPDKVDQPHKVAALIGSGIGGVKSTTELVEDNCNNFTRSHLRRVSPFIVPKITADSAPANLSMAMGILGPTFSVASACSTGADAIVVSANMIQTGALDIALTGGVEACINRYSVASFNACRALSTRNDEPQTASRPFDRTRDGFVMSEGAGVIVLESLQSAEARGVEPLAELVGFVNTSDAFHMTQPHPEGAGAIKAMEVALETARMRPSDISYINAHGTSTALNDAIETNCIKHVFGQHAYEVPVSSTKSMTGHMVGAAGAVEMIFSVLAIRQSVIPPTTNLQVKDPECDLDYVPHSPRDAKLTAAMSNSFGFGGHNSCLIVKEFDA